MWDFLVSLNIQWREVLVVVIALGVVFVVGLVKKWWYLGPSYEFVYEQMRYYQKRFHDSVGIAEQAVDTVSKEVLP